MKHVHFKSLQIYKNIHSKMHCIFFFWNMPPCSKKCIVMHSFFFISSFYPPNYSNGFLVQPHGIKYWGTFPQICRWRFLQNVDVCFNMLYFHLTYYQKAKFVLVCLLSDETVFVSPFLPEYNGHSQILLLKHLISMKIQVRPSNVQQS